MILHYVHVVSNCNAYCPFYYTKCKESDWPAAATGANDKCTRVRLCVCNSHTPTRVVHSYDTTNRHYWSSVCIFNRLKIFHFIIASNVYEMCNYRLRKWTIEKIFNVTVVHLIVIRKTRTVRQRHMMYKSLSAQNGRFKYLITFHVHMYLERCNTRMYNYRLICLLACVYNNNGLQNTFGPIISLITFRLFVFSTLHVKYYLGFFFFHVPLCRACAFYHCTLIIVVLIVSRSRLTTVVV